MISPASDTSINSTTLTGYMEKATAALPLFDHLFEGGRPLRSADEVNALVRSYILNPENRPHQTILKNVAVQRVDDPRARNPAGLEINRIPLTRDIHRDLPLFDGGCGARSHREMTRDLTEKVLGCHPVQISDRAVVGQNSDLVGWKRNGKEIPGVGRVTNELTRACGACSAMMAVGDVERFNGRERSRERKPMRGIDAPDRVTHAVERVEIEERLGCEAKAFGNLVDFSAFGRYVRNTGPVCARSSTMWRVRSSSLSFRVRSCFLMTFASYSASE